MKFKNIIKLAAMVFIVILWSYFSITSLLFTPSKELWLLVGEDKVDYSRVKLLLYRGVDLEYSMGEIKTYQLVLLSDDEKLIRTIICNSDSSISSLVSEYLETRELEQEKQNRIKQIVEECSLEI